MFTIDFSHLNMSISLLQPLSFVCSLCDQGWNHVIAMIAKMSAAITVSYCVALRSDEGQGRRSLSGGNWCAALSWSRQAQKYTFLFTLVTDCLTQSVFVLYNSVFIVTVTPTVHSISHEDIIKSRNYYLDQVDDYVTFTRMWT